MALGLKYKMKNLSWKKRELSHHFWSFRFLKIRESSDIGFSTRLGGVSKGYYSSMNLSLNGEMTRRQSVKISGVWELQSEFPVRIWYFQSRRILQMSGL